MSDEGVYSAIFNLPCLVFQNGSILVVQNHFDIKSRKSVNNALIGSTNIKINLYYQKRLGMKSKHIASSYTVVKVQFC